MNILKGSRKVEFTKLFGSEIRRQRIKYTTKKGVYK